jgi:hypothetical protein
MKKIGCIVFIVIALLVAIFIYWKYMYVYSEGYREGTLNKFSTKGVAYKTNEGEMLMPGLVSNMGQMSSNNFYFSATDSSVVETLLQATGKKVKVHYKQYNSSLPWRGDDYSDKNTEKGQYIVDGAEVVQ